MPKKGAQSGLSRSCRTQNQGQNQHIFCFVQAENEDVATSERSCFVGLRRYKWLIVGISSASEVFQEAIRGVIQGIPGTLNISDDIIIHGKGTKRHDEALKAVLNRLREHNLTLSKAKCEFHKDRLEFFGNIFSKDGLSADPRKVAFIKNASPPENVSELRSLLGMASYCSRFIPNVATITDPLRELTKKNAKWTWGKAQEEALTKLKTHLTDDTVLLGYFDRTKQTEVIVDTSPVGLGAQKEPNTEGPGRVIAYTSRALTNVERQYSQTKREALAIVWTCEHFHLYLYGNSFNLVSDHKPLEIIWNNPRSKPPARIERWGLRLQPYSFRVTHKPGKDNPADYMSRHPDRTTPAVTARQSKVAETYVNFLSDHATPKAIRLLRMKSSLPPQPTLCCSLQCLPSRLASGKLQSAEQKQLTAKTWNRWSV